MMLYNLMPYTCTLQLNHHECLDFFSNSYCTSVTTKKLRIQRQLIFHSLTSLTLHNRSIWFQRFTHTCWIVLSVQFLYTINYLWSFVCCYICSFLFISFYKWQLTLCTCVLWLYNSVDSKDSHNRHVCYNSSCVYIRK